VAFIHCNVFPSQCTNRPNTAIKETAQIVPQSLLYGVCWLGLVNVAPLVTARRRRRRRRRRSRTLLLTPQSVLHLARSDLRHFALSTPVVCHFNARLSLPRLSRSWCDQSDAVADVIMGCGVGNRTTNDVW